MDSQEKEQEMDEVTAAQAKVAAKLLTGAASGQARATRAKGKSTHFLLISNCLSIACSETYKGTTINY